MTLYKNKYRIESNRWQMWDYSAPGSYFITVCIDGRREILGQINNGVMNLSANGKIIADHFQEIPMYHGRIIIDEWIVMPNHVHCIIALCGYDYNNGIAEIKNIDGRIDNNNTDNNNVDNRDNADNDHNADNCGGGDVDTVGDGGDADNVEKIHEFSLRSPTSQPTPQSPERPPKFQPPNWHPFCKKTRCPNPR